MYARIEVVEGIEQPIELVLYHNKRTAATGCIGPLGPLLIIQLTNRQISELLVVYKIKPVRVDSSRQKLGAS